MKKIPCITIASLLTGLTLAGCEYHHYKTLEPKETTPVVEVQPSLPTEAAASTGDEATAANPTTDDQAVAPDLEGNEIVEPETDQPPVSEGPDDDTTSVSETTDHETEESDPEPRDENLSLRVLEMIHRGEQIRPREKSGHPECAGPLADPRSRRLDPDCTRVRAELPLPRDRFPQR